MAQDYPASEGASLGFEAGSPDFKSCVPSSNSHSFDFLLFLRALYLFTVSSHPPSVQYTSVTQGF